MRPRHSGFGKERMAHALGISAYLCPLPVCRDWEEAVPKSMIKYVPASWVCQGSVTAALLAKEGYTGNPAVFDGEYGFWRFYGAERWEPEMVVDGLGEKWRFMEMAYKTFPCCTFFSRPVGLLYRHYREERAPSRRHRQRRFLRASFCGEPDSL